jgi:hypothetical protein
MIALIKLLNFMLYKKKKKVIKKRVKIKISQKKVEIIIVKNNIIE